MKRLKIVIVGVITLGLVGCSSSSGPDTGSWARWTSFWTGSSNPNPQQTTQYEALKGNGQIKYYPKTYRAPSQYYITKQVKSPRKYQITTKDEQSYQNLNNKIEQRMQNKSSTPSTSTSTSTGGGGMLLPPQQEGAASTSGVPLAAPQ